MHLRRLFEIAKGGNAPIASKALERIAALYAIEKTIREMNAEECAALIFQSLRLRHLCHQ